MFCLLGVIPHIHKSLIGKKTGAGSVPGGSKQA